MVTSPLSLYDSERRLECICVVEANRETTLSEVREMHVMRLCRISMLFSKD